MDGLVDVEDHFEQQALQAPWGEVGRSATLGVVSLFSKLVLSVLNSFSVEGVDTFLQHTTAREEGRGLITVCNHTRCSRGGTWARQEARGPRSRRRLAVEICCSKHRTFVAPQRMLTGELTCARSTCLARSRCAQAAQGRLLRDATSAPSRRPLVSCPSQSPLPAPAPSCR